MARTLNPDLHAFAGCLRGVFVGGLLWAVIFLVAGCAPALEWRT